MRNDDFYADRILLNQIQEVQEAIDIVNNPIISDAIRIANDPIVQHAIQFADFVEKDTSNLNVALEFSRMRKVATNCFKALVPDDFNKYLGSLTSCISNMADQILPLYSQELLIDTSNIIKGIVENYSFIFDYPDSMGSF